MSGNANDRLDENQTRQRSYLLRLTKITTVETLRVRCGGRLGKADHFVFCWLRSEFPLKIGVSDLFSRLVVLITATGAQG